MIESLTWTTNFLLNPPFPAVLGKPEALCFFFPSCQLPSPCPRYSTWTLQTSLSGLQMPKHIQVSGILGAGKTCRRGNQRGNDRGRHTQVLVLPLHPRTARDARCSHRIPLLVTVVQVPVLIAHRGSAWVQCIPGLTEVGGGRACLQPKPAAQSGDGPILTPTLGSFCCRSGLHRCGSGTSLLALTLYLKYLPCLDFSPPHFPDISKYSPLAVCLETAMSPPPKLTTYFIAVVG